MALVDVKKVATACNLTPRRVQQLQIEGMPKEGRGQYDLAKCLLWYVRYLQKALDQKQNVMPDGKMTGERSERVRGLRADADRKEIELAIQRGDLVSIKDNEGTYRNLVLVTKARIMQVASRVAPDLVGEPSRNMIQAKIEKELREALSYLANYGKNAARSSPNPEGSPSEPSSQPE